MALTTFTGTFIVRPPNSTFSEVSPSAKGKMVALSNLANLVSAKVYFASAVTSRVVLSEYFACNTSDCLPRFVKRLASLG